MDYKRFPRLLDFTPKLRPSLSLQSVFLATVDDIYMYIHLVWTKYILFQFCANSKERLKLFFLH